MPGRERIAVTVLPEPAAVSRAVAGEIAAVIRARAAAGERCVLGLATGSTPVGVYDELVRLHREEGLSFRNVATFNLDEYWPMEPRALQSYVRYMDEHLFDHVDIDRANVHIPDGTIAGEAVEAHCAAYEAAVGDAGGIDLQLLGIGRTGHIGFNEPGSGRSSRTRAVWLDRLTRLDAASDFFGEEHVPRRGITMGVGTILEAERVILMAFGEGKASIVARAVEGEPTASVAASYLQDHPRAEIYLDEAAAGGLTRRRAPWLLGSVEWTAELRRRAVIWLAAEVEKPILKLTDEDYNENGLQELIVRHGPGYDLNIEVFRRLQETITGWPGGKPGDDQDEDGDRFPKRVLVFSPHPDDDVISMGGTLLRLVDQGHEVHVAYQVSGSLAVFDAYAVRFVDFAADFNRAFEIDRERTAAFDRHIEDVVRNKQPGQVDSPRVQQLKAIIRRGEARAAGRYCGIPMERLHFLDLPFYETGKVRKRPLGEEDVAIVADLLRRVRPHQLYAAGDLSDPHGTHRVCLAAVERALARCAGEEWLDRCELWLYRGAWQEWEPHRIEMAVPLAPSEVVRKRNAIFKHESQKDRPLFPGSDEREFWQRAEARNRNTARLYDRLGLAEYEAIEGFVRWRPDDGDHGNPAPARRVS